MTHTMQRWTMAGALAAMALAGCGTDTSDPGNTGNTGNTGGSAFKLNAALGIDVIPELALADETSHASGLVVVQRGSDDVAGADVKLNGVALPAWDLGTGPQPGTYSADQATSEIPDAAAGKTLHLTAAQGGDTASLTAKCPDDVTLTVSPDRAHVGDTVTVSWKGEIHYASDAAGIIKPTVSIQPVDSTTNKATFPGQPKSIPDGAGSVDIEVPDVRADADGWLIHLRIPGPYVDASKTTNAVGFCALDKRVRLIYVQSD